MWLWHGTLRELTGGDLWHVCYHGRLHGLLVCKTAGVGSQMLTDLRCGFWIDILLARCACNGSHGICNLAVVATEPCLQIGYNLPFACSSDLSVRCLELLVVLSGCWALVACTCTLHRSLITWAKWGLAC